MPKRRRPLTMQWLMLNVAARYYPVISILRSTKADTVLDVGCGDGGLGMFEPWRRFVGCDAHFIGPQPPMAPVVALGGALPFQDRAFDAVISLDTLEHVPAHARTAFITDLARVGRQSLVLAMPCGPWARAADRLIDGWYALRGIATPAWLAEHFQERLPDRADVERVVASLGRPYRVYGNENALVHVLIMMAESSDRLRPHLNRLVRDRSARMARIMACFNVRPTYRLLFHIDLTTKDETRR